MFRDRASAGKMLAHRLTQICPTEAVVLGVAAGGAVVGYEVAQRLAMPFDVVVVRRLRTSDPPYATLGAATEDRLVVGDRLADDTVRAAHAAIEQRARRLHQRRAAVPVTDRTVVVVDDGVMTGSTARAACQLARWRGARRVVFAAPVMPMRAVADLSTIAEDLPRVVTAPSIADLSRWYASFPAVTDEQVMALLDRFDARTAHSH